MGNFFSQLFSRLWGDKEYRILILGLDGAGKTTILYRMQVGQVVTTVPTISFNIESVTYKNLKFQVWDLGGQSNIRPYWSCYYAGTDAIIYVVDSSDTSRIATSKEELDTLLSEDELKNVPVIIFANKQDVEGSLPPAEISIGLGLSDIKDRSYQIFKTSALKGEGLEDGLNWLVNILTQHKK